MNSEAAPPEQFLQAAQRVAHVMALDVDRGVAGHSVKFRGTTFWLLHHGPLDPGGMVLVVELANLASGIDAALCRNLLEFNYATPAGSSGYTALVPGTGAVCYCVRVDFDKVANAGDAILSMVREMVRRKDEFASLVAVDTDALNAG